MFYKCKILSAVLRDGMGFQDRIWFGLVLLAGWLVLCCFVFLSFPFYGMKGICAFPGSVNSQRSASPVGFGTGGGCHDYTGVGGRWLNLETDSL